MDCELCLAPEWESERVTEWESDRVGKLESERVSEWESERVTVREWERESDRTSERATEWESERVSEWESERVTEWESERVTEWGSERAREWASERVKSERARERLRWMPLPHFPSKRGTTAPQPHSPRKFPSAVVTAQVNVPANKKNILQPWRADNRRHCNNITRLPFGRMRTSYGDFYDLTFLSSGGTNINSSQLL
jgi:hypothetical protein